MKDRRLPHLDTLAVHAGEQERGWKGATQVPVVHSVSFGYESVEQWEAVARSKAAGHISGNIYSRNSNPTVRVFEEKVRDLEGAEDATSFATGMAAVSNTLLGLLKAGDRVVSLKDTYGGTSVMFLEFLPRYGIEVALCETTDHESIEAEVAKGCQLLYLETPTNPTLKVIDLKRLSAAGHKAGAVVVCDNTFATPVNQHPLALGVDLVLHSATKFLGGHADALGGVVAGSGDLVHRLYHFREINGATLHPMSAYLLLRGMKTLHLRVARQCESAMKIATWLRGQPNVEAVFYPGLPEHPQYEIARRQMSGFGGVLSFSLKGGLDAVRAMLPKLTYAHRAANLGAVETLVGIPATTSHVECSLEEMKRLGIPEGLVRYSVGIEHSDDLIADLTRALRENG